MIETQQQSVDAIAIDGRRFYDVVGELCDLADMNLRRSDYFSRCLDIVCEFMNAGVGMLNLRIGARTLERTYVRDEDVSADWMTEVDSLVLRVQTDEEWLSKRYTDPAGTTVAFALAAPIMSLSGKPFGAVGIVIPAAHCIDGQTELIQLNQLVNLIVENAPRDGDATASKPSQDKALQSVVRASDYRSIQHLCFAIANSLCNKLQCEQITIGLVRNRDVKLIAVSGLSEVPGSTPGMQAVRQAMATCLDRNNISIVQESGKLVDQCESSPCKVHQFWHRVTAGACVATLPLRINGQCIAVVALRRQNNNPFLPADLKRAQLLAESFAPALPLVDRASRSVIRHCIDSVTESAHSLLSWNHLGRKAAVALVIIAAMWAAFGKTSYHVLAPCRIVSEQVSTVSAPFDGMIESVLVEPGQRVRAGQLLVKFDRRDLLTERNRILTETASTRIETNALLQKKEPQEAFLLQSQLAVLHAELQLVDEKLKRTEIHAATDGVILPTEIHRRVGQFVTLGEPLLEVADERHWHLEIETPENEIRHLKINQQGQFQTLARPDQAFTCQIDSISPASQVLRQKNVVLANAVMDTKEDWMKIGMEGHVKVETGRQPVWWVHLHPVLDYVRLRLWM